MKELNKEEKARRYDEVSKEVKDFFEGRRKMRNDVTQTLEYLFPELLESEDEKIRKALIKHLNVYTSYTELSDGVTAGDIIAWLEKIGQQTPVDEIKPKFKHGDRVRNKKNGLEQTLGSCIEDVYEGAFPFRIKDQDDWELVKQTPADKVETKFKVGDWVVTSYGEVSQVISVDKDVDGYTLDNNNYFSGSWCENYHLWTINDAKDGDVLVDCNKNEVIVMFRGIGNTEWDDVIDYHCYYSCFQKAFRVQKGVEYRGNTNDHGLKPASKEQRDLLFQKMKEEGYEWDSKQKKLKQLKKK